MTNEELTRTRYTTVFGIDETSRFDEGGVPVDVKTWKSMASDPAYAGIRPRPIPACLDSLRRSVEAAVRELGGYCFNFCLVNYYAGGADSIAFHSDDERFLGPDPAIASFSLGARRDFLMKHKPLAPAGIGGGEVGSGGGGGTGGSGSGGGKETMVAKTLKLPLASGDMILMRGKTQTNWLHSIPKRTGKDGAAEDGGRINITFRRAMVKGGTQNYYHYNVGTGPVYRWDDTAREMVLWKP